jgi:hypothetical protein
MVFKKIIVFLIFAAATQICAMTASDKLEYERRGLSQVEWAMILDSRMPVAKIDELMEAGISINEYFQYPWLSYGMSERNWIAQKKAGHDLSAVNTTGGVQPLNYGPVFANFFLPGYHQLKRGQQLRGGLIAGLAGIGAIMTITGSVAAHKFSFEPLFIVVPAMLYSSIDIGIQMHREQNPDAHRFTFEQAKTFYIGMTVTPKIRSSHL